MPLVSLPRIAAFDPPKTKSSARRRARNFVFTYMEVLGTYYPILTVLTTVLIAVLIAILGHLRGLDVGYKYSYNWLISTMNLQVGLRLGGADGLGRPLGHFVLPYWV